MVSMQLVVPVLEQNLEQALVVLIEMSGVVQDQNHERSVVELI
jgi:hypothetical protein